VDDSCIEFSYIDNPTDYVQDTTNPNFYWPRNIVNGTVNTIITEPNGGFKIPVFKARRIVYGHDTIYHPGLERYVSKYQNNSSTYYGFLMTDYKAPFIVKNLIEDYTLKNSSAWH
jgi:hypothetical protein